MHVCICKVIFARTLLACNFSSLCFCVFVVVQAFVKIKPLSVYRYKKTKSKLCANDLNRMLPEFSHDLDMIVKFDWI